MKHSKFLGKFQSRTGFFALLVICYWLKYIFVAYCDFNLGLANPLQHIIMWFSPLGMSIILISLGFYFSKPLASYIAMLALDFANTALLFANVLYYRQFTDFITVKTMANFSKVSQGLGKSSQIKMSLGAKRAALDLPRPWETLLKLAMGLTVMKSVNCR